MEYRLLGKTGLNVSALSVGTVSLGVDYGIDAGNDFGCPAREDAMSILREAADAGINLFDTAPAYGSSEDLLGEALGERDECLFATKVSVPEGADNCVLTGQELREDLDKSITSSLMMLKREALDIVQVHNATVEVLGRGEVIGRLLELRKEGKIRFLGATVYTEEEALSAISTGDIDVLQVAYNILDQRMADKVFVEAEKRSVGILTRSALLKGVLTSKACYLPEDLEELKRAAEKVCESLVNGRCQELPSVALRYCLSCDYIASVLVGIRTLKELDAALNTLEKGSLSLEKLGIAADRRLFDEQLLNPVNWKSV